MPDDTNILPNDQNFVRAAGFESSTESGVLYPGQIITATGRIKVDNATAGAGTVTSISSGTGILLTPDPITTTGSVALIASIAPIATLGTANQQIRVNAGATALEYFTPSAGSDNITVGTTTVTSGTNTRILYNNSGVVGEYTLTGSGTVVAMATSPTFQTSINGAYLTASEILITDGSKNIVSASVATYPSLTELTYVKGVTSAIQTQLGTKQATITFGTGVQTALGVNIGSAGAPVLFNGALGTPSSGTGTNITGIPAANILPGTLATGTYLLSENASIGLDPVGSADGKYTGITVTAVAGYTQAFGDLVYLSVTDSRWELADADAASTAGPVALAMVVVAGTDGAACTLLLQGIIRADAKFPTMTVGATQYVGETAGAIQGAIPTGADNIIRTVGYALTADELYFNPSTDWQVTVA